MFSVNSMIRYENNILEDLKNQSVDDSANSASNWVENLFSGYNTNSPSYLKNRVVYKLKSVTNGSLAKFIRKLEDLRHGSETKYSLGQKVCAFGRMIRCALVLAFIWSKSFFSTESIEEKNITKMSDLVKQNYTVAFSDQAKAFHLKSVLDIQ